LSKIFGPTYENGSWRIKTNQELDKLIKHKNMINFARAQRLGWYGHIERMQERRMVKAIHAWKPISKRPMGKPNISWEDGVKTDILTYLLTPWCRVLLEKLTGLQLVKKFPAFHGTQGSIPHSQASANCLYPGPAQSSPYTHIPLPGDPF